MIRSYLARGVVLGGLIIGAAVAPLAAAAEGNPLFDGFAASVAKSSTATEEQKRLVAELILTASLRQMVSHAERVRPAADPRVTVTLPSSAQSAAG